MAEDLGPAFAQLRDAVLDDEHLVRALASGRRRGRPQPRWRRVELRYVDLKAGRHLQLTTYDDTQAHTSNHAAGDAARDAVDDLLDEPFGNWHVETTTELHQVRVTKRLEAVVHTSERAEVVEVDRGHDRDKERMLAEDDPVLVTLGIADKEGRIKPSRQAKYRQVEEFLRLLDVSLTDAIERGHVRRPTAEEPLRIVDLGCGNAYLTFAAQRFLTHVRGLPVHLVGVDVKEQSREHNSGVAAGLGIDAEFVVGSIAGAQLDLDPEVVLALHACDTATDEALARAVEWEAALVLAAPCCHHDIAAQLRRNPTPAPYAMLTRHGILRERFADTLTDALRASLMRLQGYRVDVMQFVESKHTPRNTMLRAVRTGSPVKGGGVRKEYDELVAAWSVRPRLAELLEQPDA
jgi:SAM-dependent methyltransferase